MRRPPMLMQHCVDLDLFVKSSGVEAVALLTAMGDPASQQAGCFVPGEWQHWFSDSVSTYVLGPDAATMLFPHDTVMPPCWLTCMHAYR